MTSPRDLPLAKRGRLFSWSPAYDPAFQHLFGFYQAAWVFLLFLVLILFRRDALFLMPAVFAGLTYNFTEHPQGGQLCYPWDMPTMLFFTLAGLA